MKVYCLDLVLEMTLGFTNFKTLWIPIPSQYPHFNCAVPWKACGLARITVFKANCTGYLSEAISALLVRWLEGLVLRDNKKCMALTPRLCSCPTGCLPDIHFNLIKDSCVSDVWESPVLPKADQPALSVFCNPAFSGELSWWGTCSCFPKCSCEIKFPCCLAL